MGKGIVLACVLTRLILSPDSTFVKIDKRARVVAELKRESTHAQ